MLMMTASGYARLGQISKRRGTNFEFALFRVLTTEQARRFNPEVANQQPS
jgi:hypothetical protein